MGNRPENTNDTAPERNESAGPDSLADQVRRLFSRGALAGSAVLLSLGNRTAWGQTVVDCMSTATLDSFTPATGMFMSAPGARPEHNEALAAEIHYISAPDDGNYFVEGAVGSDGATVLSACPDLNSPDGVCLVEGSNCP